MAVQTIVVHLPVPFTLRLHVKAQSREIVSFIAGTMHSAIELSGNTWVADLT